MVQTKTPETQPLFPLEFTELRTTVIWDGPDNYEIDNSNIPYGINKITGQTGGDAKSRHYQYTYNYDTYGWERRDRKGKKIWQQ